MKVELSPSEAALMFHYLNKGLGSPSKGHKRLEIRAVMEKIEPVITKGHR